MYKSVYLEMLHTCKTVIQIFYFHFLLHLPNSFKQDIQFISIVLNLYLFKWNDFRLENFQLSYLMALKESQFLYSAVASEKKTEKHIAKLSGKKGKSKYRTRSRGQARCSVFSKLVCYRPMPTCFLHTNKSASWQRKSLQKRPNFVIPFRNIALFLTHFLFMSKTAVQMCQKSWLRCYNRKTAEKTLETSDSWHWAIEIWSAFPTI